MSAAKIVEINPEGAGLLSRFLNFLSQEKNWGWKVEHSSDFSPAMLQEFDALIIEPSMSSQILPQTKVLSSRVQEIGVLDSFCKEENSWIPRILLYEALRLVLVSHAKDLDIRAPAFVIGHDEVALVVSSVLSVMGISEIYLAGDRELLKTQKRILERSYFGIKFKLISFDELTLQAVSAGVVVNTEDVAKDESLLTDLSYFNYMKKSGYVMDLYMSESGNPLIEEAAKADLRGIGPQLVLEVLSLLWLDKLQPQHGMNLKDIQDSWRVFLK